MPCRQWPRLAGVSLVLLAVYRSTVSGPTSVGGVLFARSFLSVSLAVGCGLSSCTFAGSAVPETLGDALPSVA